ncbi:MAG: LPS assembly lipoprotein LptE [Chitinophagaceae bacterium]
MLATKKIYFILLSAILIVVFNINSGCGIYGFADVSIPDTIKTIRVNLNDNRAPYVNPQLTPALTERLRQKINNQTRLTQTNSDDADYDVVGYVSDYSVSTTGVTNKTEVTNRLTVSVHFSIRRSANSPPEEFDVSRNFEFSATQTLQSAQSQLLDEMVRSLTDDIFNRLFSNW